MCNFAIIKTGGKQYRVAPGDILTIEKLDTEDKTVNFSEVLLTSGDKIVVGTPFVPAVHVAAEILEQGRGEKIRVFKFKAKSHYSKTIGHRQDLTKVKILDIVHENAKPAKAPLKKEVTVGS